MTIITSQHVHGRNWIKCPMCDGRSLTAAEAKVGFQCGSCFGNGEVPRHVRHVLADNSSFYEQQAGA